MLTVLVQAGIWFTIGYLARSELAAWRQRRHTQPPVAIHHPVFHHRRRRPDPSPQPRRTPQP